MNRPSLDVLEEKIVQAVDQYDEVDLRAIVRSCLQEACDARIEELEGALRRVHDLVPGSGRSEIRRIINAALTQPDAPEGEPGRSATVEDDG
jgi:hypothetical protein